MKTNKFQRLFLRQYRELHEAKSPRRVIVMRMLAVFLGSVTIMLIVALCVLFLAGSPTSLIFISFGAGLIQGNSASHMGTLMRSSAAWAIVEEITNWPKVYELL